MVFRCFYGVSYCWWVLYWFHRSSILQLHCLTLLIFIVVLIAAFPILSAESLGAEMAFGIVKTLVGGLLIGGHRDTRRNYHWAYTRKKKML
jgi:hypothetical protein